MSKVILMLVLNLPALALAIGAVWLAYNDKAGWGWCLFTAIMLHTTIEWKNAKNGGKT